jgi:hypothetical protein
MPKTIPCRPLPLILRIPRAVLLALLFIAGVVLLFAVAPWFEITGGGK